jgi:hypothetical protein
LLIQYRIEYIFFFKEKKNNNLFPLSRNFSRFTPFKKKQATGFNRSTMRTTSFDKSNSSELLIDISSKDLQIDFNSHQSLLPTTVGMRCLHGSCVPA